MAATLAPDDELVYSSFPIEKKEERKPSTRLTAPRTS